MWGIVGEAWVGTPWVLFETAPPPAPPPRRDAAPRLPHLGRRQQQTLQLLLGGLPEKQIATKLELSRHTVHMYVKQLYRAFNVTSRAELLSKFVARW